MGSLDALMLATRPPFLRPEQHKPDVRLARRRSPRLRRSSDDLVNVSEVSTFLRHLVHKDSLRHAAGSSVVGIEGADRAGRSI
jgi:hypothetical protein